jgi:hypothetical protein
MSTESTLVIFLTVETVDGPSMSIQTTPICPNEVRRQRNRERNTEMDSTKREESLKRDRERKRERYAQMNTNEKNEILEKNMLPINNIEH